jgi:alpha-tubulin suppressor-like RCC1 family protein
MLRALPSFYQFTRIFWLTVSLAFPVLATADASPQLFAGLAHNLAIKTDGSLWGWGMNGSGQLGDGSELNRSSPVRLGIGYINAAAGNNHSAAIRSDGSLWTWGNNASGQLGVGSHQYFVNTPQQVGSGYKAVAAGTAFTVALKTDGSLWTWGDNGYGQLGDQSNSNKNTPVLIGTDFKAIAAGGFHVLALKSDGSLWAWGLNDQGQLGTGDNLNHSQPQQLLGSYSAIAAGTFHSAALNSDGTLWLWGANSSGELGNSSLNSANQPQAIQGNFSSVSCANGFTLALQSDGRLWSWGNNAEGALGDGSKTSRSTPLQIGSGYGVISAGRFHSLAAKIGGDVFAWGSSWYGQLGTGNQVNPDTPTPVLGPNATGSFNLLKTNEPSLTLTNAGGGSVNFAPIGIACNSDCTQYFGTPTLLNLTATPDSGHAFSGWSGDCSGIGDCLLTVTSSHKVTANFSSVTLTLHNVGNGNVQAIPPGINCGQDCNTYAPNTQVTLVPSAQSGYAFAGWSGDCSGLANCVLTLSAAREVTASFTPAHTLNFHVAGSGLIADSSGWGCNAECFQSYAQGTKVSLTATPVSGYRFVGWSGACSGVGSCQITLNQSSDLTANFAELPPVAFANYLPLVAGNFWQFNDASNGAFTTTVTVGNPVQINGNPAYPLAHSDGSIVYYTNDTNGLRIHGQYAPQGVFIQNQGSFSTTTYFNPPIALLPSSVKLNAPQSFSGSAHTTVGGGLGSYILSYSGSSNLTGPERLSVPKGNFQSLRLNYQYTIVGMAAGIYVNLPFAASDWYTQSIGLLQETVNAMTLVLTQTNQTQQHADNGSSNLVAGWNLVGNGTETTIDVASRYGDPSNVQSVWKWVSSGENPSMTYPGWAFYTALQSDGGKAYAASKGYEFLSNIGSGEGYWVNVKSAFIDKLPVGTTVQSTSFRPGSGTHALPKGWSLIGPGDFLTPLGFNNALSPTPDPYTVPVNLTSMWSWDASSSRWYFWSPLLYQNGTLTNYLTSKDYLDFTQLPNTPVGTLVPGNGIWVNVP